MKYAYLIFICDLQQTSQQDPTVLVSQVAAEKKLFRVTISTDYEPKLLVYLSRIFMRLGMQQAASSAEKVRTILYAYRHLTQHVAFRHRTPPHEILVSLPFVYFNAQQLR